MFLMTLGTPKTILYIRRHLHVYPGVYSYIHDPFAAPCSFARTTQRCGANPMCSGMGYLDTVGWPSVGGRCDRRGRVCSSFFFLFFSCFFSATSLSNPTPPARTPNCTPCCQPSARPHKTRNYPFDIPEKLQDSRSSLVALGNSLLLQ